MEKTLNVKGMMCANCQKHVHDALLAWTAFPLLTSAWKRNSEGNGIP